MQPHPQAVMAGIGDVVPALFIIIALISGLLNFLKEKKNAAEAEDLRRRKRERKRGGQPDDELSAFLNEVGAAETTAPPPSQRRRKRPSQRDRAQQRRQQREQAQEENDQSRRRPGKSGVAERHLETSEMGTVSSRHVESSVESRHLESQVADQHLFEVEGEEDAGAAAAERSSEPHPLVELLGKREGMRNAIILNEILQPPPSLRKK